MAKIGVLGTLVALAVASAAAAAEAPITISADRRIATGGAVTLSGAIAAQREGEEVVLDAKECGAPGWVVFRRERTDARGAWHTGVSPAIRTSYRARWQNARSAAVEVLSRPTIRFDQKSRNRYSVWMFALRFFSGAKGRM